MSVQSTASQERPPFAWSALLHLGCNMWDDFLDDPDGWAKSAEEEAVRPNPMGPDAKPRRSRYHSYLKCDDQVWKGNVDHCAAAGLNMVFIDLGEGLFYPSHPELAVKGTWPVEKMRKELARMRAIGLEPVPKLNFSACHDAWLKEYHRMLSTQEYYKVVADVIRDFCLKRITSSRLKGFCVAPWGASTEKEAAHMRAGISQLAEAKRHHENPV